MSAYDLAQFNIVRARAALDDSLLADFMANLDSINALAERTPGFVWRLQDDSGNATDIRISDDPRVIVNLSVWDSVEDLFAFVYKGGHIDVMARRREWFEAWDGPHMVLWWVPAGHRPSLQEAKARLELLADCGPTQEAFNFSERYTAPRAIPVAAD